MKVANVSLLALYRARKKDLDQTHRLLWGFLRHSNALRKDQTMSTTNTIFHHLVQIKRQLSTTVRGLNIIMQDNPEFNTKFVQNILFYMITLWRMIPKYWNEIGKEKNDKSVF